MMRGNIVNIANSTLSDPSLYLVSEYSTDKWAPDADHWIHTARHEAGHAVALVCVYRKFGRSDDCFERILIRPGATGSYVTRRGRRSDCLGCVERSGAEFAPLQATDRVSGQDQRKAPRSYDPEVKRSMADNLAMKIISNLAGPLAEMCSWNERADLHSEEYDWAWEDNKEEIQCVSHCVDELRAMTGSGTMEFFERQSHDLVKREWPAITALADELMLRHVLDYDDARAIIEPMLTQAAPIRTVPRNTFSQSIRF